MGCGIDHPIRTEDVAGPNENLSAVFDWRGDSWRGRHSEQVALRLSRSVSLNCWGVRHGSRTDFSVGICDQDRRGKSLCLAIPNFGWGVLRGCTP